MTPRVDIIIPTWNGLAILRECLASLTDQSFQDFVITVVDDGSTDGTAGALRAEYPGVRVVRLEETAAFAAR
jgi:glycosyltransferase involved in cell wall biosynthesis